ncbi:acid-sensing ion channel 1A-like [Babylonia areolata]|uniref:acid-sensing ion channel 1A-like n=1 Tax=Babylonia areolata TaxID=304850 RepID=UPI003FD4F871
MQMSKLQAKDTPALNISMAVTVLSLLTSLLKEHVNIQKGILESHFPPEFLNMPVQDISRNVLADLNTTLVSCFWDGQEESCDVMFQPLDLGTRRCFQFNGQLHAPRRVSRMSGLTSGLQVLMNVRQDEYVFSDVLSAGAQVILHEPGEMPDTINKGFLVSPGTSAACRTTMRKYNYLPEPFKAYGNEACVEDDDIDSGSTSWLLGTTNVSVYTSAFCRSVCVNVHTQTMCGCRFSDASYIWALSTPVHHEEQFHLPNQ